MAKTDLGGQVLQEKGHFSEFAAFIRRHGLESEDQDLILKLKSVLWAVVSPVFAKRRILSHCCCRVILARLNAAFLS